MSTWSLLPLPPGEGNGTPLQYFCLENPMGGGAWWAAGLPFPSPGDLPNSGIKPAFPASPTLVGGFFTIEPSHPIPRPPRVSSHYSINSKSHLLKYLNQAQVRVWVQCIQHDSWTQFLSSCAPVKIKYKLSAPNTRRWDRQRTIITDILVQIGGNRR